MRELWASKTYRTLFFAGFLSELGTYVSEVAILLRIYELVGQQKQYIGITQAIFLILMILGTLLGGVFGEGKAKNKILILCEVARIPILLAMLAFTDSVWVLILGNGLVAFFSGAFNPTRQALTNELLPPALIPRANSVLSMSFAFLHALGPILGALIYDVFNRISPILLFDLATYFIGTGLLVRLLFTTPPVSSSVETPSTGFFEDLRAMVNLVRERRDFLWIILRCILACTALGIVIPLLLPITIEVLKLPDSSYGMLLGIFGAGGVVGSLFLPRVFRAFRVENLLRFLVLGEALSLFAWSLIRSPVPSFVLAFLYGALLFGRITSQMDFVSLRLPPTFNARANSFLDLSMVVPNVFGAAVVAVAGAKIDTAGMLHQTGLWFLVSIGLLLLLELRFTRSHPDKTASGQEGSSKEFEGSESS